MTIKPPDTYLMTSPPGAKTQLDGHNFDYFCGTGYFALQGHPQVIEAACEATRQYGLGSATSRMSFGNTPVVVDVEQKAAAFFEAEQAMYYASGYMGVSVLLQGLLPSYDVVFVDEKSHFSSMDAAIMSRKPVVRFAHCQADDLAMKLKAELKPGQRPMVVSDGIFPTSGVMPPLDAYDKVLAPIEGAQLCVDDAHAVGVVGHKGKGTLEYFGIEGVGRYSCGTFSKALGGFGGIIAGSAAFITALKQQTKMYLGASSVPTPAAAATAAAIDILRSHPEMRTRLAANTAYAKNAFREMGFQSIPDTPVPIICLSGPSVDWSKLQEHLFNQGLVTLYVPDGSYSGVPEGGALRLSIFSTHALDQIDRLIYEVKCFV